MTTSDTSISAMYPEADGLFDSETIGRGVAPAERWYVGERCAAGCRVVVVEGLEVHPLLARTHDPLWSFSWGRSGTSARELAWSVLYDSAHERGLADDWCSAFTTEVISLLPRDAFRIAAHDVLAWLGDERLVGASDRLLRHVLLQTCPEAVDVDFSEDDDRPSAQAAGIHGALGIGGPLGRVLGGDAQRYASVGGHSA
jgi:hypothetical protein